MNLGLLAFTLASLAGPSPTPARLDADTIARRHIEAVGGAARLRAINSIRHAGHMRLTAGAMTLDGPFVLEMKRPRKARMEATLGGTRTAQWFDGTAGWTLTQGATVALAMTREQLAEQEVQAEFDDWLLDYKARGVTVEYLGREPLGDTRALKLKVTYKGHAVHSYLDAATYLEIRRDHLGPDGRPVDQTLIGNYRDVGGLKVPFLAEITSRDKQVVSRLEFDEPELNADIPDSRFAPPK
jgi:hypothetical protein